MAAVEAVRQTRGSGWFVRAEEIDQATKQLEKAGILTSWEGCASFAALQKAGQQGAIKGNAVCILTGKRYPSDNAGVVRLPLINSFDEAGSWAGSNL
ncbi:hypothetical protein AUK40_02130 [Candidatus Wirthbacteria bacterium CG2_30_54_11]|uniref:Tryptophan synthase beta chain-like PALP domain-containing protein n=1 Tax=Candidatus Wirthbacteria bacterium CG2_30_54_11 TaxID=1817892 RepID=A0A1J5ILK4_9BACT|nr:MAG: hypothetical protein AUK40_02130 [Candidatus Wirthbacteria bacterium CG2_30_54_11]